MPTTPRFGFIWDSLSRNIGDQAIGACVQRIVRAGGFDRLEPVDIGSTPPSSFDVLVIGGGELLHPQDHPYYDLFRVPGAHILNSVGTYAPRSEVSTSKSALLRDPEIPKSHGMKYLRISGLPER